MSWLTKHRLELSQQIAKSIYPPVVYNIQYIEQTIDYQSVYTECLKFSDKFQVTRIYVHLCFVEAWQKQMVLGCIWVTTILFVMFSNKAMTSQSWSFWNPIRVAFKSFKSLCASEHHTQFWSSPLCVQSNLRFRNVYRSMGVFLSKLRCTAYRLLNKHIYSRWPSYRPPAPLKREDAFQLCWRRHHFKAPLHAHTWHP